MVPRVRIDRHPRAAGLFGAAEGLFAAARAGVGPRHRMTSMAGQWPAICFCRSGGRRELLLPPPAKAGGGPGRGALWISANRGHPLLASPCLRDSEEHTSELQSQMRLTYAVLLLTTK